MFTVYTILLSTQCAVVNVEIWPPMRSTRLRNNLQDETDSIAETDADREMKREGDAEREAGAINLTSRWEPP